MKQLLAVNLKVQCLDGTTHNNARLFVEDNQRVYIAEDGSQINNVDCVMQCTSVVPPMLLAMKLHACRECQQ